MRGLKENGRTGSFTARESRHYLMEPFLMETGRRVDLSDKGFASIQMAQNTLEAGSTASLTELE